MKTTLNGQVMRKEALLVKGKVIANGKGVCTLLLVMLNCILISQTNTGAIRARIAQKENPTESIPFANILVYQAAKQVAAGTSDIEGNVWIKSLRPGLYDVKAIYIGYETTQINQVKIDSNQTTSLSFFLSNTGLDLQAVTVTDYRVSLVDPNVASGSTIDRAYFQQMAFKNVNSVISTQAGVIMSPAIQVRGSRMGNTSVYIDGERAIGTTNVAQAAQENRELVLGGLPAQYEKATLAEGMALPDALLSPPQVYTSLPSRMAQSKPEEYAVFKENGFYQSSLQPLSTFAIDVDGASYSNTRRMLHEGVLPPKEAVRVEEFINYFTYRYPQPKNKDPFSISTELSECPWNKTHSLLQVGIKGKELEANTSVPNNLVFLIDVSGSMSDENKLPLLKRAFKLLVKQLRKEDRLSIVVYAGNSGALLEGVSGNETDKIISALENLEAGGSTAGGEGINLAYKIAAEQAVKNGNNRVILATDGDFNVGVSSETELQKLIEEKRDMGIYLSVLGFGEGNLKDAKMEVLADKGNGNYYYIDNFMEARKVLVSQFSGTLYTIAKDVKIQVEFNPEKVKAYRLIGYDNRLLNAEDFNDDRKDAGELGAGHSVTALYEIIPAGIQDTLIKTDELKYTSINAGNFFSNEIATIKFRYKGVKKEDRLSHLIKEIVLDKRVPMAEVSVNFKLAAGVAEFAQLLRGSEYKGLSSFKQALELVRAAKDQDPEGYVSGLLEMMQLAKELMPGEITKK